MRTVFLVDNFFNDVQHPDHVLSASSSASGHEPWRVGTARRTSLNGWTPTELNTEAWVRVDCGTAKSADMVAIDRGHNLAGRTIALQRSSDGSAWTNVASVVVPAEPTSNGVLTTPPGVHTTEGAWLLRFTAAASRYWRLHVPAMGADLRPYVVGLYLGSSWAPTSPLSLPMRDLDLELAYTDTVSDALWAGGTRAAARGRGAISIKLEEAERPAARAAIREQFIRRARRMWIVFNDEQAEDAVLAYAPPQEFSFPAAEPGWMHPALSFEWAEHEPLID